jgi:hypothetical protein
LPPRTDRRKKRFSTMTARALKAKKKHGKRVRARAEPAALVNGVEVDAAKAHVMTHFRGLVADGLAERQTLDDGTIRLSLNTGEIYLLKKTEITRIA